LMVYSCYSDRQHYTRIHGKCWPNRPYTCTHTTPRRRISVGQPPPPQRASTPSKTPPTTMAWTLEYSPPFYHPFRGSTPLARWALVSSTLSSPILTSQQPSPSTPSLHSPLFFLCLVGLVNNTVTPCVVPSITISLSSHAGRWARPQRGLPQAQSNGQASPRVSDSHRWPMTPPIIPKHCTHTTLPPKKC
jgi:hypothetical protein